MLLRRTRVLPVIALALGAVFLAACGTTTVDTQGDADGSAAAEEATGDNSGPVTVTDYEGLEVTLDEPAQRVVTLEWAQTENVEVLGGNHVGVADMDGYALWASAAPVDDDVTDVGLRTEPSLEAIGRVDPDLILGVEGSVPDGLRDDLERIAPVVLQAQANAHEPFEHMEEAFFQTAELLGAQDRADEVWQHYEDAVASASQTVADNGADGAPFVLVYPAVEGNTATFRMHGPGSLPVALGERIGLEPAWDDEGDAEWAISQADVEALTALPDESLFFWWTAASEPDDPFASLESNSVWAQLGFVENDAMHPVHGIWIYGGPAAATQWVNFVADTVS